MRRVAHTPEAGFTIIEITIVMGLLSVFMVFLLQIVFTTTEVFESGQRGQELATRALAVRRPAEEALAAMIGPTRESKSSASDARLLVQWAPIGFVDDEQNTADGRTQVLRATVRVDQQREKALLQNMLKAAALDALGAGADPEELLEMVNQMLGKKGFKGRGEMLLLAWPEGDKEGAYFDLRRGFALPGRLLGERYLGNGGIDARRVRAETEVVATGLLHMSMRFASQLTTNWINGPKGGGPELCWDSARRGWLSDAESELEPENFSLDLGAPSSKDSTDDVFPRYIELTLVAGMSSQSLPDSQLAVAITESDRNIRLINTDRLPDPIQGNYLKIGSEWVRFSDLYGNELRGVRRGQRGTRAKSHDRETGVRAGKTETIMIPIPHTRDSWNG